MVDLVEEEIRELLTKYEFPGKDIPIIRGSALKALEGDAEAQKSIEALLKALDDYIPQPERPLDKPFLMAVEDVFSMKVWPGTMSAFSCGELKKTTLSAARF